MSIGNRLPDFTETIGVEREWPFGGEAGIELAQAARCGIARIGKRLVTGLAGFCVEFLETCLRHENLAAHLEQGRIVFSEQLQGNGFDSAHVAGHVLTPFAVTPCCTLDETAVFISQADGETVKFRFSGVDDGLVRTQPVTHAAIEIRQFLFAEDIIE